MSLAGPIWPGGAAGWGDGHPKEARHWSPSEPRQRKEQWGRSGRRAEKRIIRWEDEDGDSTPDPEEEQPPRVTRYLHDGAAILATFTETGRERARYTPGLGIDEPLAELHRQQLTFYYVDTLGSILALTDASGQPLRQYHYQAFGLPEDSRADRQPFRFTAREWDKEVGLYHYRARYYDPRTGRFTQEDPIGTAGGINLYVYVRSVVEPLEVGTNLYEYAHNNPLVRTDPLGLWYIDAGIGIAVPQAVGGVGINFGFQVGPDGVFATGGLGFGIGAAFTVTGMSGSPAEGISSKVMVQGGSGVLGGKAIYSVDENGLESLKAGIGYGIGFGAQFTPVNQTKCLFFCKRPKTACP